MPELKEVILVVDDEQALCETLAAQLVQRGYEVVVAHNGEEALAVIERKPADIGAVRVKLILCDWSMPVMDGLALLQRLRAGPWFSIPVILMSGAVTREQLVAVSRHDPDAVLIKPFNQAALYEKVAQALKVREDKELARALGA